MDENILRLSFIVL